MFCFVFLNGIIKPWPHLEEKKKQGKKSLEKSLTLCLICIQAFVMVSTPLGGTLTDSIDIHQGERLI